MFKGRVTKSTGSWYAVLAQDGRSYQCRLRGKFKLVNKKITNPIAVGDWVVIEEDKVQNDAWIITEIAPRTNYIIRRSPKKTDHGHLIAANIDQAIIIATIKQPVTSTGFIDRLLVTAESYRIPSRILINKKDLLQDQDLENVQPLIEMYAAIGYPVDIVSANDKHDVEHVKSLLTGKFSMMAGHSGVGKSTMLNALVPHADQQVNEVSSFANKGVHTTTFAEVFEVAPQSYVIDTPGIKELGLLEIEKHELSHYFPEMRQFLGECKFNDCQHLEEPGCRILEALESGGIHTSRYYSYLSMIQDSDNRR
ncbi:MAG: ribosome small subunit-dependent GTPase A [Cyclobacteriaceae bacterium]